MKPQLSLLLRNRILLDDGSSGNSVVVVVVALSHHLPKEMPSKIGRLLYLLLCGP